ncbi:anthranilate synthase component I, partial [Clavibacter michiganensis subsp. insidiosus]
MSETPRPAAPSVPASSTTTREAFGDLAVDHRVIPVLREVFADGETPVGVHRKLTAGRPGSFLLESAGQGGIWTRFSFVGVSSFGVLTQQGDEARWLDYGMDARRALGDDAPDGPLAALAALYARWETPRIPGMPPLTG